MLSELSIAVCQIEPSVGDLEGNCEKIRAARAGAAAAGADLAVFCELVICGYPPEDLVRKPAFRRACRESVEALAAETADGGPAMIVGAPWAEGDALYNACFLLNDGRIEAIVRKARLPNYGVFDEPRVFAPAPSFPAPIEFSGAKLGLLICEDLWLPGVGEHLAANGADLLIAPHGSPFRRTALAERLAAARERSASTGLDVLFVNQLAGQDEIVFDGASFAIRPDGETPFRAPQFEPAIELTTWRRGETGFRCIETQQATWPGGNEEIYRAVTLGVRDYVEKNRFPGVVIGLSGGVDSALTAAFAVDALGPERVRCVMLPSRYTSRDSLVDAEACAGALGVAFETIPIEPAVEAFAAMLAPVFKGRAPDVTEENVQSRIRGLILMALSNKFGEMVLTTGNKSEMSVGYATLYGDMNGGYNPLKDIYKTDVYRLCQWRNGAEPVGLKGPAGEVIPTSIITKPPSAELRFDQTDQDSLPDYNTLDAILQALVEEEKAVSEIVAGGYDEEVVRRVENLLYVAEYKRRQAPPGPKVTRINFGRDRRYPITNSWRSGR
ncbi:MAG: NAD+ synthase [Alphaproteobacteria bacterium]|nr:NAD+ synthase [Alphaproteobacteria bacterium]